MLYTFTRMNIQTGQPFKVFHIQAELDEQTICESRKIKFPNGIYCYTHELNRVQEYELLMFPHSARLSLSLVSNETKNSNVSRLRSHANKRLSDSIELVKGLRRLI